MTATQLRSLLIGVPGNTEVVISDEKALKPIAIKQGCELTANQCALNGVTIPGHRIVVLWTATKKRRK